MKRACAAALMMITLVLSLTGCQGVSVLLPYSEKSTVTVTQTGQAADSGAESSRPAQEEPAAVTIEPVDEPVMPEAPEEEPVVPEPEVPAIFEPGVVTERTYENKTLGIGLKLDENWTFLTPEELSRLNSFKGDITTESVTAFLEEPQEYIDVDAYSGGIGDEIMISAIKYLYLGTEDMNEVAQACIMTLEEDLKSEKMEKMQSEIKQIEFLGQPLYASVVTGILEGNLYTVVWLHDHKNGYYYSIRLMIYGERGIEPVLNCFYSLEEAT